MTRPEKLRKIGCTAGERAFKPIGRPIGELEVEPLRLDELEALRLADLEGLYQETAAARMGVSRPTFQRILVSARQKIANALLNGKAVRIEGGNFEISPRRFRCSNNHEWEVPFEAVAEATPQLCPACNAPAIEPLVSVGLGGGKGQSEFES